MQDAAPARQPDRTRGPRSSPRSIFSTRLADGRLVELLYRPEEERTLFAVWNGAESREKASVESPTGRLVPFSGGNNLLRHGVVLLPSHPEEYGSESALVAEVQAFIHIYVDLAPVFETLAAYYVLLTWIYDGFNELPYLRVRGEPGSGKTRFLQTVGSLCYKPIFASGASTVSPIFRILDIVQGTLVMDESDFRMSDEKAELVKILNNGNARGFPVLRSELVDRREYDPRAYTVFGPKIVATRGFFDDRALESRFLTEDMGRGRMRSGIPVTLPPEAERDALALRNKLLLFRFRNHGRRLLREDAFDPSLEPRLNQVFGPMLTLIDEPSARASLSELVRQVNRQQVVDRGLETEAHLLEVIRELLDAGDATLAIGDVAAKFVERFGEEYERKITRKWIGWLVRRKLLLRTHKSDGVFVIPLTEQPALERLFERYGISSRSNRPGSDLPRVPHAPS